MNRVRRHLGWLGSAVAALLSPPVVALGVPLAYGIGSDILASAWMPPLALLAAAAIALNAWRRGAPQTAKSMS